jgi:hypothetical protein
VANSLEPPPDGIKRPRGGTERGTWKLEPRNRDQSNQRGISDPPIDGSVGLESQYGLEPAAATTSS